MTFVSYAQNYEDVMLWRALKHVNEGFYIDVGANDPTIDSITKAFYERGWRGINIEPLMSHYLDLQVERPRDINLCCAAGETCGTIEIFECDIRGWATAQQSVADKYIQEGHVGVYHRVPLRTLSDICKEYVSGEIHFLKIDVEGVEKQVISGADFQKKRPWIVVVEATKPGSTEEEYEQWEGLLFAASYQFAYADGLNRFYVASERASLLPAFKYPPNVFDGFALSVQCQAESRVTAAESRAAEAEIKARQAEVVLNSIYASHLWRITSPLRWLQSLARKSRESEADRAARWEQIQTPTAMVKKQPRKQPGSKHGQMNDVARLRTIAVDLTPVLPGGHNGGAKIVVVELLPRLATLAPATHFILLTNGASHEELSSLDAPNVSRLKVVDTTPRDRPAGRLRVAATLALGLMPARYRTRIWNGFQKLHQRKVNANLLRSIQADLLFCPFTAPTYHTPGIPTVCTFYDVQYKTYPQYFEPTDVLNRDRSFREACRHATALAAISDYSRTSAINQGGVSPDRIRTIHLRMAQRINAPSDSLKDSLLASLGLQHGQFLLYPANFWKHKNHEMLLIAFLRARSQGLSDSIKLVCTGAPGDRREWLMKAIQVMGLQEHVILPGYLSNEELSVLLHNSRGMIFPSLYEGFGLPVIEAMAAGIPVACSNVTSLPEVAGGAATLFDPRIPAQIASALCTLATDDAERARCIMAGRKRAAELSDIERMAGEYLDIFEYARTNMVRSDMLSGTYSDGWIGETLHVTISPETTCTAVELKLRAPEWLPDSRTQIHCQMSDGRISNYIVHRGDTEIITCPAHADEDVQLTIGPCFIPSERSKSPDNRQLSLMLQHCALLLENGDRKRLYPE